MKTSAHQIATQQLLNLNLFLSRHYGIEGEITPLAGELDLNFKLLTAEGTTYLLKLYAPDREGDFIDFQAALLEYINSQAVDFSPPKLIKTQQGAATALYIDSEGQKRKVQLLSWIAGHLWNHFWPQTLNLHKDLGVLCGQHTSALKEFNHDYAKRTFDWDIANALWTKNHLKLFNSEEQQLISKHLTQFEQLQGEYDTLQKSIVHNDANDFNIILSEDLFASAVNGLIDFGDAVYTQIINDLAVCCTYGIMGYEDPLEAAIPIVSGYHQACPIEEKALKYLYLCIALRLIISVTKSKLNRLEAPDNTYLQISDKAAWELLKKWSQVNSEFAYYRFREACELNPHPQNTSFTQWAKKQELGFKTLFPSLNKDKVHPLDLSLSSTWLCHESDFNNLDWFDFQLAQLQKANPHSLIGGGYLEVRPLYTSADYDKMGNDGPESRCMHLGVDFWVPAQTPVHAIFSGELVYAFNDEGSKKFGGLVILRHQIEECEFYTLYGHLSLESITQLTPGDFINQGSKIGVIGNSKENGHWSPHLHFQILLSLLDYGTAIPGVAFYNEKKVWRSLCPDPNLFFKSEALKGQGVLDREQLRRLRAENLGRSLSLQYKEPLHIVRGSGAYLIDHTGKKYLDTVNNVAHVGHEHPRVVKAGQQQMAILNTNSRYLHKGITALATQLKLKLPKALSVLHFVNSGSEANELALRMVQAATGSSEILVSQSGYHGNTKACVAISSYKFEGKGGSGPSDHVHVFPMPDLFRGKYRSTRATQKYIDEVEYLLQDIEKNKKKLGGFIIEPILSCGGQIELPQGFLKKVYSLVHSAGGLCISDEVQTGCGRMGATYWGFQLYDVIPDIVTIGKPLGNGHPVAAVACTEEVALKFANGMEYFNTFGGNPVSCAIASEVLQVVEEEKLQQNALETGNYLKNKLSQLAQSHPIIGDVRGQGLFLGFELVTQDLKPLATHASHLVNRMKTKGILMSTDGPDHNVIKIKPPLVFSKEHADFFIETLSQILSERTFHTLLS